MLWMAVAWRRTAPFLRNHSVIHGPTLSSRNFHKARTSTCKHTRFSGSGAGKAPPTPNIFQSGFSDSSKSDAKLLPGGRNLLADCVAQLAHLLNFVPNRLINNEFFVPFMKLLNCKSLFSIYWKSTLDCMESPLCCGFSALGLDRNIF